MHEIGRSRAVHWQRHRPPHCRCFQVVAALAFSSPVSIGAFSSSSPHPSLHSILCCDVPNNIFPILEQYDKERRAEIKFIEADDEDLTRRLEEDDVDAFIIRSSNSVSKEMLQRLPCRIRAIGRAGVGCDNIDLDACKENNVPVITAAGANAVAVAEHTLGLTLALARKLKSCVSSIADGRWERASLTGIGLRGKTIGVVGFGAIGAELSSMCHNLGMNVLVAPSTMSVTSENPKRSTIIKQTGATEVENIDELLQKSDFVSIHLPLTDSTRHFIGNSELSRMKPTAMLISTARGGVVDETALLNCLKSGQLAGAALDVFESEGEQLHEDDVLMELVNMEMTIVTPHVGGHTKEAQVDVWRTVMDRLLNELNS